MMDIGIITQNISFMDGRFAVKHFDGKFNAVPMDMCLEQTMNKSLKDEFDECKGRPKDTI